MKLDSMLIDLLQIILLDESRFGRCSRIKIEQWKTYHGCSPAYRTGMKVQCTTPICRKLLEFYWRIPVGFRSSSDKIKWVLQPENLAQA